MAYRPDIDGMRAVAVAGVVAFHARPALAPGGFSGVDIFFAISGYLISRLIIDALDGRRFRFGDFYARRLVRLAPALAVVLAACWGFGWLTLLPSEYAQLGTHVAGGAGFLDNVVFWTESGYFDTDAASKPLLHLWSLGVEEQFYLVWPPLVALAWWRRVAPLRVMLGLAALSFAVNIATVHAHPAAAFYLPPSRLWELSLGGALACRSSRPRRDLPRWLPTALSGSALVLLVTSFAVLGSGHPFPGWWALMPIGWALATIAAGPDAWVNRVVLSHPLFTFVGAISYPLYLWHWPLLTFARIVTSGDPGGPLITALVAASVLLAWLTYRFVEQPVQNAYRAGRTRWLPARLAAGLALVAIAGVSVRVWSHELPPRFPSNVQALVDFEYDYAAAYRERRCYLMPDQPQSAFAPECVDADDGTGAPLVVLWGRFARGASLSGFAPAAARRAVPAGAVHGQRLSAPAGVRGAGAAVLPRRQRQRNRTNRRPEAAGCTAGRALGRVRLLPSRRHRRRSSPRITGSYRAARPAAELDRTGAATALQRGAAPSLCGRAASPALSRREL
jgi:peptidoglycan/LPS O-acetylase OafA/YrhL